MEPQKAKVGQKSNKKPPASRERGGGAGFELCEVCNLNHDQGRRHKYFPSHHRSFSALLSRFKAKLTDLRFFLRNPALLRPEDSALNRLWCVFCALDLRELDSSFACSNAINHLASSEHLKNLKDFLRKHGGGMDQVDLFRVSEEDFLKWEKGCSSLKSAGSLSSEGPIGPQLGPTKDIQNELTTSHPDSFQKNSISSFNSSVSNAVMPLQSLTYEGYRLCHPEVSGVTYTGPTPYVATSLSVGMQGNMGLQSTTPLGCAAGSLTGSQPKRPGDNGKGLAGSSHSNGVDQRTGSREDCTQGFLANVHTGALPPWLETSQENEKILVNEASDMSNDVSLIRKHKLNPKRVGAAWADKRRVELEREKRGEITADSCDANWLPNFGRVWQAGTRKESRKEFEMEKRKFFMDESQPEISFKIQPYISKRMQVGSHENDGALDGGIEDFTSTS